MKYLKPVCLLLMGWCSLTALFAQQPRLVMDYNRPAENFNEALPIGNGRLGAMIYGKPTDEVIHLNEGSLWGGKPIDTAAIPDMSGRLKQVREALFKEDWDGARQLLRHVQGQNAQAFLPMGDLRLHQELNGEVSRYVRTLDLNQAVATTHFSVGDVGYTRELFVSNPARVMVIRLTASKPKALSFDMDGDTPWTSCRVQSVSDREFVVSGQLGSYMGSDGQYPYVMVGKNGERGMRYQYRVRAVKCDGEIYSAPGLRVRNASEVVLLVAAETSYNGFDKRPDTEGKDEAALAKSYLDKAEALTYDSLLAQHIADYGQYFNRVQLVLDLPQTMAMLPLDERLKRYAEGAADPALEMLYFQFGRYLLISSSRLGGVPANLQGIWNKDRHPAWGSDYTTNINLEMNYWPAEPLALSELTEPLIQQIQGCAVTGTALARKFYQMKGWTIHHNTDIWCTPNPVGEQEGDPKWANWALGSGWLCQHLYEHYRYTQNKTYLATTAYPLMKSAADFCMDWLIEKDGHYITAPSTSPENAFLDEHGKEGVVTIGSAMDMEIIWDLLNNLIEASQTLHTDAALRAKWMAVRDKLMPLRVGKKGNLIEWYKDWEDVDPQHRHVSHLFALYPGREISPIHTPELAAACRSTLEVRGDGGTGWSKAWKINFWARLLDGDHAYKMLRELLSHSTLPNLFDTHPPFQIDGNFGSIAGVAEMLLQSQHNELHLLPALPSYWNRGMIKGMQGRGAFTVDMEWADGKLTQATILSREGGMCTVRTQANVKVIGVKARTKREGNYYVTTFSTTKGKSYRLHSR